MGLMETIVFYLLFGIGVAAAVALTEERGGPGERWFRVATAVFFWPLYLPILLERPVQIQPAQTRPERRAGAAGDELAEAIAQVEAELESALDSLDGWAENVLAREQDRFAELRGAWRLQAERIRQIDRLLASTAGTAA